MRPAVVPPFHPLRPGTKAAAPAVGLFFVGAACGLLFVESATGPVPWLAITSVATAVYVGARSSPETRAGRAARAVARGLATLLHALWLAEAVVCATMLSWTIAPWTWMALGAVTIVAAAAATARWQRLAVPPALPLGALSASCLIGWAEQEWRLQCDDVLAIQAQAAVRVVVPVRALESCAPGDWLPIGRYPRKVWAAPDGARVVFTTQQALHEILRPSGVPGGPSGFVCESALPADASRPAAAASCLGERGKAHAIVDDLEHDRLLVGILSGLDGRAGGIVSLTRSSPMRELGRVVLPQGGNFYLDPANDRVGEFGDEGRTLDLLRASDFTMVARGIPASFLGPDFVRYDPQRHEGVACAASGPLRTLNGEASLAVAFRGVPFAPRPLAPSSRYPSSWLALSWGCDWTADRERVFVSVATLGQVATIDRRSGDVTGRAFVGFGVRPVTYDERRGVLYVGNFLRGEVLALDPATGAVGRRWFAGRFVRDIELTADGGALLVTSNAGIVRIDLGPDGERT